MSGKRALIFGVASNRSIAWGIAKAMQREGAEMAFTYMGDRLRERVEKLAGECDSDIIIPCDVENDDDIEAVFEHHSDSDTPYTLVQWRVLNGPAQRRTT